MRRLSPYAGLDIIGIVLMVCAMALLLHFCSPAARAQEHRHPPEHATIHEEFYAGWYMPDNPTKSCCNKADCAPAQARFVNGKWQARRESDAAWRPVPPEKIERNRDSPDGRSHLCAPWGQSETVYCFIAGTGG